MISQTVMASTAAPPTATALLGQGRHGGAQDRGRQPYGTRHGSAPVGVVVHVAGCAGQGAVIDVGEGWPEHDRREDVGAVDDRGGCQGRGDEQLSQDSHDAARSSGV